MNRPPSTSKPSRPASWAPGTPSLRAGGPPRTLPGQDVLVLIISCRRHGARRRALRATWINDLSPLGLRHLFVVGEPGRPARLRGDVLSVDSRDNYEYLVLKVLRAMAFVHQKMPQHLRYVFKVDDDCYVNPRQLLKKPFRASPYSGRVLEVRKVLPDATWHVGKCEDPRYETPYTRPYRCDMATGIGYFIATRCLEPLAREIPRVRRELDDGLYDFEDKRVAETLWSSGFPVTPLAGYGAVFLDKEQRFTAAWRVDPEDHHRFPQLDIITECNSEDLHRIHRVVRYSAGANRGN